MAIIKKLFVFILLDIFELALWIATLSPFNFLYVGGPIDSQNKFFLFSLLALYVLIPFSFFYFLYFIVNNYRNVRYITLSALLNIHLFLVLAKLWKTI
jgi:hypothetical protein